MRMLTLLRSRTDRYSKYERLLADDRYWAAYRQTLIDAAQPLLERVFFAGVRVALRLPAVRPFVEGYPLPADLALKDISPIIARAVDQIVQVGREAVQAAMEEWATGVEETSREAIISSLVTARLQDLGSEYVLSKIQALFSPERAQRIATTEVTRFFGAGATHVYRAAQIPGWEWQTVEDRWTCPICAGKNDEQYPLSEEFSPAHPACRCFPKPVTEFSDRKRPPIEAPVFVPEPSLPPPARSPRSPRRPALSAERRRELFFINATKKEYEKLYAIPGYTVTASVGSEVNLVFRNKAGVEVAEASRRFYSRGEVHHSLLVVRSEFQGENFAALLNSTVEKRYRKIGLTNITLFADIDVGKYAWARQGYDFVDRNAALQNYRSILESMYRETGVSVMSAKKIVREMIRDGMHSWEIAALDDGRKWAWNTHTKNGEGHIGKALMLRGGNWNGEKLLDPASESAKIGDAYFKVKK